MTDPGGEPSQPTRRRVLSQPGKEKVEGRTGCIVTGAVLGVIFGIMFALYALPPILRSIYGEDVVEAGERYETNDRQIGILAWERTTGTDAIEVRMVVRVEEGWATEPSDWLLVLEGGALVEPRGPRAERPETSMEFGALETREFVLVFPLAPGQSAEPDYVRLSRPKVRFKLGPAG